MLDMTEVKGTLRGLPWRPLPVRDAGEGRGVVV